MSLDVYLYGKQETVECTCQECSNVHNKTTSPMLFDRNITHNLQGMADAVGLYEAMWRPEELGITKASELINPLEKGLEILRSDPFKYKMLNPKNGWGNYEGLVDFVREYLDACKQYPDATIEISR